MPEIPISSPLSYVGTFLLISGFFLVLAGSGILRVEKITVKPGSKTWGFGIILAVFGAAFLLPDIVSSFTQHPTPTLTPTVTISPVNTPTQEILHTSEPEPVISTPTIEPTQATSVPPGTPTSTNPAPIVSLEQAIRDYYSFIEQGQYAVAWEMAREFRIRGETLSFNEYVNAWEESGSATISSIDVEENGNEATVTLTLYYLKKDVYHTIRYELVCDVGRGSQRFGYWLFATATLLD